MSTPDDNPFADAYDGPIPEGVDEAAVGRMRLVARVLDDAVRVPGTDFRIGLDPVLGAIPGVGDVVSGGISLYIVLESARLGVSYGTLIRMLANVTIDVAGGAIPYVGTVIDAVWKSNQRNIALALEDLSDGASETLFASVDEAATEIVEDAQEATEDVLEAAEDASGSDEGVADDPVTIDIEVEEEQ